MYTRLVRKILPPLIPYIAVSLGLLVFHNAWLAILGYHAGMVAVMSLSKTGIPLKQAFKHYRYSVLFLAALVGAGGGLLLNILWPFLSVPDGINSYIRSIGLNELTWPVFLAYFILVNPLIEEYYWRGCLAGAGKGVELNDFLFSGYHLIVLAGQIAPLWLIVVFFTLTIAAWLWRQMNRLNGGLLASVISHVAADITVMLTIYALAAK